MGHYEYLMEVWIMEREDKWSHDNTSIKYSLSTKI